MSRYSFMKPLIGVSGACLLGLFAASRCSPDMRPAARATDSSAQPAKAKLGERQVATASGKRPALGASLPGAEEEAAQQQQQQRLAAAEMVISVPPAGHEPHPLRGAPAGEMPELPPEVQVQRQTALAGWKIEAQKLLSACVVRPEQDRKPVALEVSFAPAPRAEGESQQVFMPDWILVPSHELQRLWHDTDPEALQACLDRVRSLNMAVPLSGNALAHDFRASAESVLVHL